MSVTVPVLDHMFESNKRRTSFIRRQENRNTLRHISSLDVKGCFFKKQKLKTWFVIERIEFFIFTL